MQTFNYHTHTRRCKHAQGNFPDEGYVVEHIRKGFKTMAFTDHCPQKERIDLRRTMRMDYSEKDEYLQSIRALKQRYKYLINIKSGYEVEYLPGQEQNLFELKDEVDLIILGQHFIYDDSMEQLLIFRHHAFSEEEIERYADYLEEAARIGLPDIIAHPDIYMLGRSFGPAEEHVCRRICEAAQKYSIPLEINFGQVGPLKWGKINKLDYPCREFWEIASEYDIKVLYGLDAHWQIEIEDVEESFRIVNETIGQETLDRLKFCDENFEVISK